EAPPASAAPRGSATDGPGGPAEPAGQVDPDAAPAAVGVGAPSATARQGSASDRPGADADHGLAGTTRRSLADMMTAPGGRASTPRLVALVKGRIARFGSTAPARIQRPAGLSQAFQPPV
ncbi:MAG: transcriptional regulator, partial [Frankia sp.]|nr:transcriptional regulator [Frankia sp.]